MVGGTSGNLPLAGAGSDRVGHAFLFRWRDRDHLQDA
jgi:hypothetical protein